MVSQPEIEEILKGLARAVIAYDEEKAAELAKRSLEMDIDPNISILEGLARGMEKVGQLYEKQEYYVPELLLCADALNAGLSILKPHIKTDARNVPLKVVIGTVEGDIHDIGKNLVRTMYEAAGWQVFDLGADVKTGSFPEEQQRTGADVVALSSLMTTSMAAIPGIIGEIKARDPHVIVMAGGAPLTRETAKQYGADGYAENCSAVVRETLEALSRVKGA